MKEQLEVYPVKTKVLLEGAVPGVISAVFIRETGVAYEVVWWDGRKRNCECLAPFEFTVDDGTGERLLIGFAALARNGAEISR